MQPLDRGRSNFSDHGTVDLANMLFLAPLTQPQQTILFQHRLSSGYPSQPSDLNDFELLISFDGGTLSVRCGNGPSDSHFRAVHDLSLRR